MRWALLATLVLTVLVFWWQREGDDRRRDRVGPESALDARAPGSEAMTEDTEGSLRGVVRRHGAPAQAQVSLRRLRSWRRANDSWDSWDLADPALRMAEPVAGVERARTATDAEGSFRFARAPILPSVFVARAEDGAWAIAPARDGAVLELPARAYPLRGRLVDRAGEGVAGYVRALLSNGPTPWMSTDASGAFVVGGLPHGRAELQVRVPGRWDLIEPGFVVPSKEPAVITVDAWFPRRVSGRVNSYDDDRPVAGAQVMLAVGKRVAGTTTDAEGRFDVPAPARDGALTITAPGFAPMRNPVRSADATYLLLRGATLAGRVVIDDGGRAIAGASVQVRDSQRLHRVTTDSAGVFILNGVVPGEVFFTARAPGWRPRYGRNVSRWPGKSKMRYSRIVRTGERTEVVLRMQPSARVHGVVRDEDGRTLLDARVLFSDAGGNRTVMTDGAGRFSFETYGGERHSVRVGLPGREEVSASGSSPFEIAMGPRGEPQIVVVTLDGSPIPDARVTVTRLQVGDITIATTDAEGRAFLEPVRREAYSLLVEAEGFVSYRKRWQSSKTTTRVQLRPGVTTATRPEPDQSSRNDTEEAEDKGAPVFRVRILDARGRPVPAGLVRLTLDVDRERAGFARDRFNPDDPGLFPFRGGLFEIERSRYFPWVGGKSMVTMEFLRASNKEPNLGLFGTLELAEPALPLGVARMGPIPLAGDHEVRLPAERRLSGRVVGPDGKPVVGVMVWAWPPERTPGKRPFMRETLDHYDISRTDANGAFTLGRLRNAPVDVVVEAPRGFHPAPAVRGTPGEALTIALERGAVVAVRVVDHAGQSLEGASVRATLKHWIPEEERKGLWLESWGRSWKSDANGVATLAGLVPEATYDLRIRPPRDREELAPERVQAWKPGDIEVRLGAELSVRGVVVDSRGRPRPEAYVRAEYGNGAGVQVKRERDGSFLLRDVPAGTVRFRASIRGAVLGVDAKAEPVEVPAGSQDVRVIIDLPPTIEIHFNDWPQGEPALPELRSDQSRFRSTKAWVQEDGVMRVVGIPGDQTWTGFVGPLKDGRFAILRSIRPTRDPVRMDLQQGGEIRGVVRGADGRDRVEVFIADRIVRVGGYADEHGAFVLRGVPPGRWKVVAMGGKLEAETEASPGESIELTLEAPVSKR
ncbi:MAG: carboxypeptidase-like regulatory domain-containing protein [Planctomycetota bacterium]